MANITTKLASGLRYLRDNRWLAAISLLTYVTAIFWFTDLDLDTANRFYDAHHPENGWHHGEQPFWRFFYHAAPIIILLVLIGSLSIIIMALVWQRIRRLRIYAIFILLTFVLGPGLLVNTVFKDHWGRPRPDAIQQFGGHEPYFPPLRYYADGDGKSFPSGHSSVGFALLAFWLIWRKRNLWFNQLLLISTLSMGILIGLSRMAAGAHFLSDVLWSAVIPIMVMLVLYYPILNIPRIEQQRALRQQNPLSQPLGKTNKTQVVWQVGLGVTVIAISLFNIPVDKDLQRDFAALREISIHAEQLHLTLHFENREQADKKHTVRVQYRSRGFGLPWNQLQLDLHNEQGHLQFIEKHTGIYSELHNRLHLYLPDDFKGRLNIQLDKGTVKMLNKPANLIINAPSVIQHITQ
ncbi:MAG TPA: phosphatase PAP2 family protein [Thiothrix sp.]|nr:phosphatase PAP2 family protein [Thiothrix sp.]